MGTEYLRILPLGSQFENVFGREETKEFWLLLISVAPLCSACGAGLGILHLTTIGRRMTGASQETYIGGGAIDHGMALSQERSIRREELL